MSEIPPTSNNTRKSRDKLNGAAIPPASDGPFPVTSNDDLFTNPEAFRVRDLAALPGEVRQLVHLTVRKPGRREYVRVHPDPEMTAQIPVFLSRVDSGSETETYMVRPEILSLVPDLQAEMQNVLLTLTVTREGVPFWWRIPYGGGQRGWYESALAAASLAREKWVRLRGNIAAGAYEVFVATGEGLPEPVFPDKPVTELLRLAFKDRVIDRADHRVIRQLRGEL
jgi:hypothetical protein